MTKKEQAWERWERTELPKYRKQQRAEARALIRDTNRQLKRLVRTLDRLDACKKPIDRVREALRGITFFEIVQNAQEDMQTAWDSLKKRKP